MNAWIGDGAKNPDVNKTDKHYHSDDKTGNRRQASAFAQSVAALACFLVNHEAQTTGNPDALLFVFGVAENAAGVPHY